MELARLRVWASANEAQHSAKQAQEELLAAETYAEMARFLGWSNEGEANERVAQLRREAMLSAEAATTALDQAWTLEVVAILLGTWTNLGSRRSRPAGDA